MLKEYEWLRTLAHISAVGIYRADREGRCIYANERWCELAGKESAEVLGSSWQEVVHEEDRARITEEWRSFSGKRGTFRTEFRYAHRNGRTVWVLGEVAAELDGQGKPLGYVTTCTDISELRALREELERSNAELEERMRYRMSELRRAALIVQASDDAIISSSVEGKIVSWNQGAEMIFGYTAAEMIGQTTLVLTPPDWLEEARDLKVRVRRGEEVHHQETVRVAKSGQLLEVSLSIFPLRDQTGAITGTCAIVRDVTERKRSERRLRQLSWRLLRLQDEERRRLARELHDSTAQTLAALCMNLAVLAREDPPPSDLRRRQILADSQELAERATTELRSTSYLLHPPLLDERGLAAALRWYVEGFADRSKIDVQLEVSANLGRLQPQVEMTLFRVVQESFLNVLRHSGSSTVSIVLKEEDALIVLEIRDRGRGLPPPQESEALGVGIAGMKERLLQLGGRLVIQPNHPGTAVIALLPRAG
ncbi:MAG TPA: PAS domain S-box protein [Chthoniobacteraceae bacterium]|jgi:PAS domain S-box-containing protein